MRGDHVDVEAFLSRPLLARIATDGPTLRPVWYLFEDGAFWWLTDSSSALAKTVGRSGPLVIVVDACDLATGEVICVRAKGRAELVPLDRERAIRKFARYLGPDRDRWDPRFVASLDDPAARLARLVPETIDATDLSFVVT